jgi:protein involved in polysaccharide export with SLBB domain
LLNGEVKPGDTVRVGVGEDETLTFTRQEAAATAVA